MSDNKYLEQFISFARSQIVSYTPAVKENVSVLSGAVNNRSSQMAAFHDSLEMEAKRLYIEASTDDKVDVQEIKAQLDAEIESQMSEWKKRHG